MKIFDFQLGPIETNCFLVFPDEGDGAILIDAPEEAAREIPAFLEKHGRRLSAILLTHGHWDHVWDAAELKRITGAKIYASKEGAPFIESPDTQKGFLFGRDAFEAAKIDVFPEDGETLEIADVKVKCLLANGHCAGSLVYAFEGEAPQKAFVGDVIFKNSIGRYDFPTGNFDTLAKSIRGKIYTLPDDAILIPGHGPITTVGEEKHNNAFVRE